VSFCFSYTLHWLVRDVVIATARGVVTVIEDHAGRAVLIEERFALWAQDGNQTVGFQAQDHIDLIAKGLDPLSTVFTL
jgi:hypothetical protein